MHNPLSFATTTKGPATQEQQAREPLEICSAPCLLHGAVRREIGKPVGLGQFRCPKGSERPSALFLQGGSGQLKHVWDSPGKRGRQRFYNHWF